MDNLQWVSVQQKAFLRWCNDVLKKRNIEIQQLDADFQDGCWLIELLEILSSKSIKHNLRPRMKVQKMENLNLAMEFLKNGCHMQLVNIGSEDIYEGNLKLILGLIWLLILNFKIKAVANNDQSNKSDPTGELLNWVNSKIPDYNVKNFTSDWQSGKALCALANALLPDSTRKLVSFTNDPLNDATKAVQYASSQMGITVVMDPEDIVQHPDQHSMMTYITYFREFSMTHQLLKEDTKSETTPDLAHCIAYGVGLEGGNVNRDTYFTVEVRNAKNRLIPQGGHNIVVRVTAPHSQFDLKAADKQDGTYYVQYTPQEDGNYTIEVKLGDDPISNSPFYVSIAAPPPETTTDPEPHWFYYDSHEKTWVGYDNNTSDAIEKAFQQQNYGGSVEIKNKNMHIKVDMSSKEEMNLLNKKMFGGHEKKAVLRGTWFWETDQKKWAPYTEEIAVQLEKHYQEGLFDKGEKFEFTVDRKKIRRIQYDGRQFRQYRIEGDRREGRLVTRGYEGNLIERLLSPRK